MKLLRGEKNKDRINEAEPLPPAGEATKPAWLSVPAEAVWDELAPICQVMGTLTRADAAAFSRLCELEATARMVSMGKEDPAWDGHRVERETATALRPYYEKFGLEPAGRSRIKVPQKAEPVSKWSGLGVV